MNNHPNTNIDLSKELDISCNAKKLFKKMNVLTLKDACNLSLESLRNIVKGNLKYQGLVDELWEYVHNNNCCFLDEKIYYQSLKNAISDFNEIKISDLFMSKNARKYLANYGTIENFLKKLKQDSTTLKSFLCLVVTYEFNTTLEELFSILANDGKILSLIIKDFKNNLQNQGTLRPIFTVFPEKSIYYPLIRYDCWLVCDILALSKEEITQIPRLGPSKTHKVITTLEEQGFSFMNTKYLKNVTISLAYFKIETLNLEEKTLNKLKENDIFNLEQLLEKRSFAYFTDGELFNIQREIAKLNLNLDDKLLTSPPKLLEKNYNQLTLEQYTLQEKLNVLNREKIIYERMLKLSKKNNRKD